MAKASQSRERVLDQLVERQINWSQLQRRVGELPVRERTSLGEHVGPFVTISRSFGSGGSELARVVAERLGWTVLDKEIVDFMADRLKVDRNVMEHLDEARANWVRDLIAELVPHEVVDRDTYLNHLERVVKMVALQGKMIFVGRCAQFFLPRSRGLLVRVVATDASCTERIVEREGCTQEQARQRIEENNRARADLVSRYFNRHIDDPLLYDLVLNGSSLSVEQMAELIVATSRMRGLVQ